MNEFGSQGQALFLMIPTLYLQDKAWFPATIYTVGNEPVLLPISCKVRLEREWPKSSLYLSCKGTYRTSDRSWKKRVKFLEIFSDKLCRKTIKKGADFVGIFRAILLEIDHFCTDKTSVFNVSLTEINRRSFNKNIHSRNEPEAKLSTSWLVPSCW